MILKLLKRGHSPYWYLRKFIRTICNFKEYKRRKDWVKFGTWERIDDLHRLGYLQIIQPAPDYVIRYCRELSQELDPKNIPPQESSGKDFWRLLINNENIDAHPEILSYANSFEFKRIASIYLGSEAVLSNVTLMKSYVTDRQNKHSQLWHLDGDDSRMLLFYVYIDDVDKECGPFELVPKNLTKKFLLPRFLRRYTMRDQDLVTDEENFKPISVEGTSGTVFACDTASTYHRGSRCIKKGRLALSIRYTSFSGLFPFRPL